MESPRQLAGSARIRVPLAFMVVATPLMAAVVAFQPTYAMALAAGVLCLTVIRRWPVPSLVVALIVGQEISNSSGNGTVPFPRRAGNQLYYHTFSNLSPLLILVLVVLALVVVRAAGAVRWSAPLAILVAVNVWVGAYAFTRLPGLSVHTLLGVVNQDMRPYLLMLLGYLIGVCVSHDPKQLRSTMVAAGAALTFEGVFGLYSVATYGAAVGGLIFYDSALPALAAAVILALLVKPIGPPWARRFLYLACAVIVLIPYRRNVWLAMALVLALTLILAKGRGRLLGRLAVVVVVGYALTVLTVPSVATKIRAVASITTGALGGSSSDASTNGHANDISAGLAIARAHPWAGLGPDAVQPEGLYVASGRPGIYVHNELIEDWLRFGLAGVVLIGALALSGMGYGVSALRHRAGDTSIGYAVSFMFLLVMPISTVTAPFLSTTQRWPTMTGLALGLVVAHRAMARDGPPAEPDPADAGRGVTLEAGATAGP